MTDDAGAALAAEDRQAITELFARYGWCFDAGDVAGFTALFTTDAVYELDGGRRFVGHEQIGGYLSQAAASTWFPGRQHHIDQIIIEGGPRRATSRAYCTVTQRSVDGSMSLVYLGRYADTCVKVDGRWLFEQRVVRRWDSEETQAARLTP